MKIFYSIVAFLSLGLALINLFFGNSTSIFAFSVLAVCAFNARDICALEERIKVLQLTVNRLGGRSG